ncbi:MAG: hypothetical protein KC657_27795 [Myxococcales bacterium]|nr:hypothetical protein [Myxococcales bacterium]
MSLSRACGVAARAGVALSAFVVLAGCGYRPVVGASSGAACHVVLARSFVADAVATEEVLAGMREELARRGALEAGQGHPRCVVEVLRIDEASEGLAAVDGPEGAAPAARAVRVSVVGRAWREQDASGAPSSDTGDVRAASISAPAPDARGAVFNHGDASRAAARRLGRALASRLLGLPAASEE